jgi:hypothetical protein
MKLWNKMFWTIDRNVVVISDVVVMTILVAGWYHGWMHRLNDWPVLQPHSQGVALISIKRKIWPINNEYDPKLADSLTVIFDVWYWTYEVATVNVMR